MYAVVKAILSFYTVSIILLHGLFAHDHGYTNPCVNTLTAQHTSLSLLDRIEFFIHRDLGPGHLEHVLADNPSDDTASIGQVAHKAVYKRYKLPLHRAITYSTTIVYVLHLPNPKLERGPPHKHMLLD